MHKERKEKWSRIAHQHHRPVMVSGPPLSVLPREDMMLRPLGSDGEPETAAGLITEVEKPVQRG